MVDCGGLENRWARKGPGGSNPSLSAKNPHLGGYAAKKQIPIINFLFLFDFNSWWIQL